MRRSALVAAAATLIALTAAAPALAERAKLTPLANVRAGEVQGTRAFAALSYKDGRVRVYVCDGTLKRRATVSQWFSGRWDGHSARELKAGGLTLRIHEGGRTGELIQDGTSNTIQFSAVKRPAGLFQRTRAPLRGAWIVLPGGRIRGALVDPRPRKCRAVQISTTSGPTWVMVCG
jgi:hypothetical protein